MENPSSKTPETSLRIRPAASRQTSITDTATTTGDGYAPPETPRTPLPSFTQRALSQTLTTTANLANLLPTGTLLAFQLLTPIFTNNGSCDAATRPLTLLLLALLAASCLVACFTDSYKSDKQVYYGLATFKGMWLFDYQGAATSSSGIPDLSNFKLRAIDWVHVILSVFVFAAMALRDKNVINCLYPMPTHETQEVLDIVPLGIGLICSLLFVVFPTRRHGIGYPVTHDRQ